MAIQTVKAIASAICFLVSASANQQPPPLVTEAVSEIMAACTIGPTETIKESLRPKLSEFFQKSTRANFAKSADLAALFEQIPTDTEEARAALKDERARNAFFIIYFNCISHQVSLKLRSLDIDIQ
jgi:hypothetical protein